MIVLWVIARLYCGNFMRHFRRIYVSNDTIDVHRVTGRDLAERDEAGTHRGLEIQSVLHGDVLEESVLSGRRRQQGETGEEAKVSTADRIDRADAGGVAEDRLEDEAESEALFRQTVVLGRPQILGEVIGAKLQEVGKKEEAASAGRRQPALKQGGDVVLDVVSGDNARAWLAGAVEDFDLLLSKESGGEWRGHPPFFFARPLSASTCPTSLALTVKPIWVSVSAISSRLRSVSKRVRMMRASTSLVRFDGLCGPGRSGRRSAGDPLRTAWRIS